jgi:hypothetical protein
MTTFIPSKGGDNPPSLEEGGTNCGGIILRQDSEDITYEVGLWTRFGS